MDRQQILAIARKLCPDFDQQGDTEQQETIGNLLSLLYSLPLTLVGLGWLISVTDWAQMLDQWPFLLLNFILLFVFDRFSFFTIAEIYPGTYSDWQASFENIVIWSIALILGPEALWVSVIYLLVFYGLRWRRAVGRRRIHALLRNLTFNLATRTPGALSALLLYHRWGGSFPLPGLGIRTLAPTVTATLIEGLFSALIWLPYLVFMWREARKLHGKDVPAPTQFWFMASGWQLLSDPLGILAANLYTKSGVSGYLSYIATLLFASILAHRLSKAVAHSQQRAREMKRLDLLSNALLSAPLSMTLLSAVLEEHAATLFPYGRIEVRIFPEETLMYAPADKPRAPEALWDWTQEINEPHHFPPGRPLPWDERLSPGIIVAPILDLESDVTRGGVFVARQSIYPETIEPLNNLLPAVQSLSAQIASAIHNVEVYEQTLAHERMAQELQVAGQIQASFLPRELPHIPGWEVAATLRPARETSGDFYDVIPLPNGRFGILIADVADKGTGAALYMALSRTLLRTYALQYHTRPDYVLRVANRRILMDTDTDLFVTVFYGVLDPATGALTYSNAGHMPPYVLSDNADTAPKALIRTGMPLGLFESMDWDQDEVVLGSNETLLLYTDGVTDAEDPQGVFLGRERLIAAAQAGLPASTEKVRGHILAVIHDFVDGSLQLDDITLMILAREQ